MLVRSSVRFEQCALRSTSPPSFPAASRRMFSRRAPQSFGRLLARARGKMLTIGFAVVKGTARRTKMAKRQGRWQGTDWRNCRTPQQARPSRLSEARAGTGTRAGLEHLLPREEGKQPGCHGHRAGRHPDQSWAPLQNRIYTLLSCKVQA